MLGSGIDGVDFGVSGETELCLSMSGATSGSDIFIGANNLQRNGAVNLIDGTACN